MSASSAQPLPDDHPAWKDLRPLGYELTRWLQAMSMLQKRWSKGRFSESLSLFLSEWMPQDEVPAEVPPVFEVRLEDDHLITETALSAVANPAWQALLHLPALRDFWIAELRASHYAHLGQIIPQAWCLDSTPVPPGSVIAGLGISGWDRLADLEAAGRVFIRHQIGQGKQVLVAGGRYPEVLRAVYRQQEGQITLDGAFRH